MLQHLKNLDFKDTADSEDMWRNKVFIACCISFNKTELFLITQILHVLVNNNENVTFSRKVSTFQRKHTSVSVARFCPQHFCEGHSVIRNVPQEICGFC